jgi:hypothetical protein
MGNDDYPDFYWYDEDFTPPTAENPENVSLDDATQDSTPTRPKKVNGIWNAMKEVSPNFASGAIGNMFKRFFTSYWNPQTNTWDNEPIENITYGSIQNYNFETNEYEQPQNPIDPSKLRELLGSNRFNFGQNVFGP